MEGLHLTSLMFPSTYSNVMDMMDYCMRLFCLFISYLYRINICDSNSFILFIYLFYIELLCVIYMGPFMLIWHFLHNIICIISCCKYYHIMLQILSYHVINN